MRPIRIAYLHQYFATPAGGTSTRSYELSRHWRASGHHVEVISGRLADAADPGSDVNGIVVSRVGFPYAQHFSTTFRAVSWLGYCVGASWQLFRRRASIDVVYATSTPLTVLIPSLIGRFAFGLPYVFEVRDVWPEVPIAMGRLRSRPLQSLARRLAALGYRHAHSIVALSPDMARTITSEYGVPQTKIVVASNGTHINGPIKQDAWPEPATIDRGSRRRVVVYAGTLGPVNDPTYLVRLCASVRRLDQEIEFSVLGSGSEWDRCAELAADLGILGNGFTMQPRIPKPRALEIIAHADVSLSTTANIEALWANSANKVFESLGVGTPVAINHGGWLAQLLQDEGVGLVMDPEDVEAAALQLIRYLRSPAAESGNSRARRCREVACQRFDWRVIGADVLKVIESAAADAKGE